MKRIEISIRLFICYTFTFLSCSQSQDAGWQHRDLVEDGVFGVSTENTYQSLLKGKKAKSVIVAILDGGFDVEHGDLKPNIWVNKKEIPDNGIDDDKNGYIDDVKGWNFVISSEGNVLHYNSALTRLVRRDEARFSGLKLKDISPENRSDFQAYQKNKTDLERELKEANDKLASLHQDKITLDAMLKQIGHKNPIKEDFINFMPKDFLENRVRSLFIEKLERKTFIEAYREDIIESIESLKNDIRYSLNLQYIPKINEAGNPNIGGWDAIHGTHVAGIVAAARDNGIGINGIADHVLIMPLRCVPGREEDYAKAILYAVDNGAKIINMSFGEYNTFSKAIVDKAVKYAQTKDILFINAAGNSSKNVDKEPSYPNRNYLEGGTASAWITVGASDHKNDETLRAKFSNYGKTGVDVFAPGVRINSCIPGSKYRRYDGTSMASPIVTGLAGLIRSYFPELSAIEVKDIILKSVSKADQLRDRCISGGVVNAYSALQLAEKYKSKHN